MFTRQVLQYLRNYESRNVTFVHPEDGWPIVWARARGCQVWDPEGRRYLDLTAAFGVAAAGHANPRVVRAGQRQMATLLHAMGDVHPHALKAALVRELSRLTFQRWKAGPAKTLLTNSGFEAVEAALKTARLATGRPGVIAFEGAYHGLGYGALNATHRDHFRQLFLDQLGGFAHFAPYPDFDPSPSAPLTRKGGDLPALESRLRRLFHRRKIGAVLVEPMQARGGIRIPHSGFLPLLRRLCDEFGALLVLDEIYTGFGRTGRWFACEHSHVVPDVLCLGKALTGGFPLSACVGRAAVMDAAWPPSTGEAIHTSTFLGHPVGCAMALAQIEELRTRRLPQRASRLANTLRRGLTQAAAAPRTLRASVRVVGLFAGLALRHPDGSPAGAEAVEIVQRLLRRGFVFLPEGKFGEVISLTPPLVIQERELIASTRALREELARW